jgi:hypothetical protein
VNLYSASPDLNKVRAALEEACKRGAIMVPGEGVTYTPHLQPHDVLAWINDAINPPDPAVSVALLGAASNGARASIFDTSLSDPYTLKVRPGYDFIRPDPYAAVFALAEKVMEARDA